METSPSPPPEGGRNGLRGRTGKEIRDQARDRLIQSRLTPNAISIAGLIGNLVAAGLILGGFWFWGGIAFILGSVMDVMDGRYSRMSGKGTMFGAFLDSTLDRIEEGVVLTAIAWRLAERGDNVAAAACVFVVLGSLMVSYTRARAEALGVDCKVGLATRPVRVVVLSIGILFANGVFGAGPGLLVPAIWVMAVLTTVTVAQRVRHVRNRLAAG